MSVCLPDKLSLDIVLSFPPTDVTVGLSCPNYFVSEGDEVVNISLELTGNSEREITVLIQTQNGSATGCLGG